MEERELPDIFAMGEIFSTVENTIQYLKDNNLLRKDGMQCHGKEMRWQVLSRSMDGYSWVCRSYKCRRRVSIRHGSFFSGSNLSLKNILVIIYAFAIDLQCKHVHSFLPRVSKATLTDWYNFCREICTDRLQRDPVVLGDSVLPNGNSMMEINDRLIVKKRKRNSGASPSPSNWVFGIVERESTKCIFYIVGDREPTTLVPLVQRHVAQGSTIYTDHFQSYRCLHRMGYTHQKVCHKKDFIHVERECTNTIKALWGLVKTRVRRMSGVSPTMLPGVLDEVVYRHMYGQGTSMFGNFTADIAAHYDVMTPLTM